ncbi:DUF4157 domain-containing protein [Leptolyngbya sp. PL-A3]|uniref:eCIS core domain-containing protein n=1 Tax=Leptolyngbya sp. PL-A3 TaxID=2933911 RepID=UPI0032993463
MSRQQSTSAKAESKPVTTSTQTRLLQNSWGDREPSPQAEHAAPTPVLHEALDIPIHSIDRPIVQRKLRSGSASNTVGQERNPPGQTENQQSNQTGLPAPLKAGVERLSGFSMDRVNVHYNSSKPARLQASAYTKGTDIYIGPGQEKHLPHEAWHVVQQKRGRVSPTLRLKDGRPGNDDERLEHEADVMGEKALQMRRSEYIATRSSAQPAMKVQQEGELTEASVAPKKTIATSGGEIQTHFSPIIQFVAKRPLNPSTSESDAESDVETDAESKRTKTDKLDVEYWLRAVVKPNASAATVKSDDVVLGSVWISEQRRPTAQEPQQGDHLVAWAAMVSFWSQTLTGLPLKKALEQLQEWLLKDQIYDVMLGGKNEDKDKRTTALTMIQNVMNTEDTLELKMVQFEEIVSLFVEANQHSQFATIGKASGGHGEADAREKLKRLNEQAGDSEKFDDVSATDVKELALILLDIGKVNTDESGARIVEKAVASWYEMLISTYKKLKVQGKFGELESHVIKGKTVDQWVQASTAQYYDKKKDYLKDTGELKTLATNVPTNLLDQQRSTLATAELLSNQAAGITEYSPSEVILAYIEVPDVRAETQFGDKQGAHTIAWTFKRQSLQNMFKEILCKEALEGLEELTNSDKENIDTMGGKPGVRKKVKDKQDKILSRVERAKKEKYTLTAWKRLIEDLLGIYVEANQMLPATTYYGAYNPTGHAEGSVNKVFADANPYNKTQHYAALVKAVPRLVDLGILYLPMLTDVENYATYTYLGNPVVEGDDTKLDKVIEDIREKADEMRDSHANATNIFGSILQQSPFSYKKVGPFISRLPIDKFDEVAASIKLLFTYLSGDLNYKKPLEGLLLDDPDKLPYVRQFTNNIFNCSSIDDFNKNKLGLVKRLKGLSEEVIPNYRNTNASVKVEAAERQKILGKKLKDPVSYFDNLYTENENVVNKIIGEYWHHLPYYHSKFYADLKGDEDSKKKILKKIFLEPMKASDEGIGVALRNHLIRASFDKKYIENLESAIGTKAEGQVATLMPDLSMSP